MFWDFIFKYFYPDQLTEDPLESVCGRTGYWECTHINGIDVIWSYDKIDNRGWYLHIVNKNIKTIDVKNILVLVCKQNKLKYIETDKISYLNCEQNKIRKIKNNNINTIIGISCSDNRIKSAKMYQVYYSNVIDNKIKDASYNRRVDSKNIYLTKMKNNINVLEFYF